MREEFGLGRIFLHASRLALEHPETGMSLVVESSLPSDLARVLESLEAQESD